MSAAEKNLLNKKYRIRFGEKSQTGLRLPPHRRRKLMQLHIDIEHWPFKTPFRITGYTFTESPLIVVTVTEDGVSGRGEAAGVYYRSETPQSMTQQLEAIRPRVERGLTREALQTLLPPGGARNALDCAGRSRRANVPRRGPPAGRSIQRRNRALSRRLGVPPAAHSRTGL